MLPFEYALLDSGELVCVMWPSVKDGTPLGFVWYVAKGGARNYELRKIYCNKNRSHHDQYLHSKLPFLAELDPIGGWMVRLPQERVKRLLIRKSIKAIGGKINGEYRKIADKLGIKLSEIEITGSALWDEKAIDLDILISSIRTGYDISQRIRDIIALNQNSRLSTSHWNDKVHHRRFFCEGVEVCFRTPIDCMMTNRCLQFINFEKPKSWKKVSFLGTVVDDRMGHCTPTFLKIAVYEWLGDYIPIDTVYLFSSESAHAMRFITNDLIRVDSGHLVSVCKDEHALVTIWMGEEMKLRPMQAAWWAR